MAFKDLTSQNQIKLIIQGIEIPTNVMSGYSYYDAKTYFTEPQRTAGGEIVDLNSYATFFVPRIRFNFNAMPIGAYRILGKLAKQFNEVIVTAYDLLEDKYVTHKMYFGTQDFPEIFHVGLETARLVYREFELIGTNAPLESISLIYNNNTTPELQTGKSAQYGFEIIVGDYDGDIDPMSFSRVGYKLKEWNTEPDGSGLTYQIGEVIKLTTTTIIYAVWQADSSFVLSFDYQGATGGVSEYSKEVIQGNAVGELPEPVRNGYVFSGWFTQIGGQGTQITNMTTYSLSGNLTVYAYWVGINNTLSFNNNGGIGSMPNQTIKSGETFQLPKSTMTKENNVFIGWTNSESGTTVIYKDEANIVMPTNNLTLYALYDLAYTLTYNTDGGLNDGFQDYGKTFNNAIYTKKDGYSLAGWYNEPEFTTAVIFPLTITADKTIYARWVENEE